MPIEKVADPVFSEKMMGDGYGVKPTTGEVYSPVVGTVTSVFPSKHAIGILTDGGLEVLVHMGIDTVELNGEPFTSHVKEGDKVTSESLLSTMDLKALAEAGKDDVVVVVLTNMNKVKDYTLSHQGPTSAKVKIGKVELIG